MVQSFSTHIKALAVVGIVFSFFAIPTFAQAEEISFPVTTLTHTGGTGCNNNSNGMVIGDGLTCSASANNSNIFLYRFGTDSSVATAFTGRTTDDIESIRLKWKINVTSSTGVVNTAVRLTYNNNNSFIAPNFTGCTNDGNSTVTTTSSFDGTASTIVTSWTGACGQVFINSTGLSQLQNSTDGYYFGANISRISGTNSYTVDGAELIVNFKSGSSISVTDSEVLPYEGKIKLSVGGDLKITDETTDSFYCIVSLQTVATPKTGANSLVVGHTDWVGDIFVYDYETTQEKTGDFRYIANGDLSESSEWSYNGLEVDYFPYLDYKWNYTYACYSRERNCNGVSCTYGEDELIVRGQSDDSDAEGFIQTPVIDLDTPTDDSGFTVSCSATDLVCRLTNEMKVFVYDTFSIDSSVFGARLADTKSMVAGKVPFGYAMAVLDTDTSTIVDGASTFPPIALALTDDYTYNWSPNTDVTNAFSTIKTVLAIFLWLGFFTYVFIYSRRITQK